MGCMSLILALQKLTYTTNAILELNQLLHRMNDSKGDGFPNRALSIQLFHILGCKKTSWYKLVLG